jgi:hypothetical protein
MCNRYRMSAKQVDFAARCGIDGPFPEDETFPPPELLPKRMGWVVSKDVRRPCPGRNAMGLPSARYEPRSCDERPKPCVSILARGPEEPGAALPRARD